MFCEIWGIKRKSSAQSVEEKNLQVLAQSMVEIIFCLLQNTITPLGVNNGPSQLYLVTGGLSSLVELYYNDTYLP